MWFCDVLHGHLAGKEGIRDCCHIKSYHTTSMDGKAILSIKILHYAILVIHCTTNKLQRGCQGLPFTATAMAHHFMTCSTAREVMQRWTMHRVSDEAHTNSWIDMLRNYHYSTALQKKSCQLQSRNCHHTADNTNMRVRCHTYIHTIIITNQSITQRSISHSRVSKLELMSVRFTIEFDYYSPVTRTPKSWCIFW